MCTHVMVRKSDIEGFGVFAVREFAPSEIILTIDDSYLVNAEHPLASGEDRFCDYLGGGKILLMQVPERHINHCCDPNVFIRTMGGARRVVARRHIHSGEEIAYDYCINGFGDEVWTCNCCAASCRHLIHSDFFHLPLDLQRKYLPLLDEWFLKERAAEIERLHFP